VTFYYDAPHDEYFYPLLKIRFTTLGISFSKESRKHAKSLNFIMTYDESQLKAFEEVDFKLSRKVEQRAIKLVLETLKQEIDDFLT
jgi:hypothetical protein